MAAIVVMTTPAATMMRTKTISHLFEHLEDGLVDLEYGDEGDVSDASNAAYLDDEVVM